MSALIRRRARVRLGNQQLAALGRPAAEPALGMKQLVGLVRHKAVQPVDASCFLAILVADRAMALARRMLRRNTTWSQDATTR